MFKVVLIARDSYAPINVLPDYHRYRLKVGVGGGMGH